VKRRREADAHGQPVLGIDFDERRPQVVDRSRGRPSDVAHVVRVRHSLLHLSLAVRFAADFAEWPDLRAGAGSPPFWLSSTLRSASYGP